LKEVFESLLAAPEYVNPAIALATEFMEAETRGDQDVIERAIRAGTVERAITDGQREGNAVGKALGSVGQAPPIASKKVPVGF
jgi:hypothetical protein